MTTRQSPFRFAFVLTIAFAVIFVPLAFVTGNFALLAILVPTAAIALIAAGRR